MRDFNWGMLVCSTSLMASLCSTKNPLDVVRVGAWNSLGACSLAISTQVWCYWDFLHWRSPSLYCFGHIDWTSYDGNLHLPPGRQVFPRHLAVVNTIFPWSEMCLLEMQTGHHHLPPKAHILTEFLILAGTEALKGHRVVWKIEIYYLIRMT